MMRGLARSSVVTLALVGAPVAAHAGGLFVPGIGPIATSRAGAYVANASDPSAIGVNPAGLTKSEGVTVLVGANFLDYSLEFQRAGAYDQIEGEDHPWEGQAYESQTNQSKPPIGFGDFQALPMIAVAIDLEDQVKGLHVGAGLIVPTSYPTRDFSSEYEPDDPAVAPPPSRYDIVKQEAAVIMPSIAAAYRINDRISVGGRFTWGIADLKATTYTWAERNYEEAVSSDARFQIEGKDNFVPAFGLGVQYLVTDAIELGLNFDSQMNTQAKGTGAATSPSGVMIGGEPVIVEPTPDDRAKCAPGGAVGALKTCVDIHLPMVVTVGGRYRMLDGAGEEVGDVELDVAWERWSAASDHHVIVDGSVLGGALDLAQSDIRHNFDDVFSVRLGGSYRLGVGDGLTVRGGVAYDTAAAPEGWERLDIDGAARTTAALGVAYPFGKVTVAAGGGFVYEGTREVSNACNPTVDDPSCAGGADSGPDPVQPLTTSPFDSPVNAGTYESSYVMFHLAAVMRF
jgi:long-subunit fatty acid transport protein